MRITRKQLRKIIQEELGRINEAPPTIVEPVEPVPAGLMAQALRDFPDKTEADLTYSPTEDGTGYTGFNRMHHQGSRGIPAYPTWNWQLRLDGRVYVYEDPNPTACDAYYDNKEFCDIADSDNWYRLGPGLPLEDCVDCD